MVPEITDVDQGRSRVVKPSGVSCLDRARSDRLVMACPSSNDAPIYLAAKQAIWITETKRQADDGGDRTQSDVALAPVEADAN